MAGTLAPERTAEVEELTDSVVSPDEPWITIVWNDPINLMTNSKTAPPPSPPLYTRCAWADSD